VTIQQAEPASAAATPSPLAWPRAQQLGRCDRMASPAEERARREMGRAARRFQASFYALGSCSHWHPDTLAPRCFPSHLCAAASSGAHPAHSGDRSPCLPLASRCMCVCAGAVVAAEAALGQNRLGHLPGLEGLPVPTVVRKQASRGRGRKERCSLGCRIGHGRCGRARRQRGPCLDGHT
jgi:hypothetical protein